MTKNSRGRFIDLALIKGINDNESWNVSYFEWTSNFFLHLGTKRLLLNPRIGPQDFWQLLSKQGVLVCELKHKCQEHHTNVASFLEIS